MKKIIFISVFLSAIILSSKVSAQETSIVSFSFFNNKDGRTYTRDSEGFKVYKIQISGLKLQTEVDSFVQKFSETKGVVSISVSPDLIIDKRDATFLLNSNASELDFKNILIENNITSIKIDDVPVFTQDIDTRTR